MNGKKARQTRRIAAHIRKQHQHDVEKRISEWPWYKRVVSWAFPKIGSRWADKELEWVQLLDDYAERRTYKYLKRMV